MGLTSVKYVLSTTNTGEQHGSRAGPGLRDHVVQLPQFESASYAGLDTGGRLSPRKSVRTQIALDRRIPIVAKSHHAKRTRHNAGLASDATVLVHQHGSRLRRAMDGGRGTHG